MDQIKLGNHEEIPVYAQRWAYLANRTSKEVMDILSQAEVVGAEGELSFSMVDWAGSSTYGLLNSLVPTVGKRMPEYEWHGYISKEAWDNQEYDPDNDPSPTIPEIIEAFNVAIRVNRFDLVSVLKNIIDPKELRGPITKRIASAISRGSLNSQQANGESELTNSSQMPPTSGENGESPSPDSTSSSESTSEDESEN